MATHKVRVGTQYLFYANLLDREYREHNGRQGVVINLHGCPPPNTMGHAYVQFGEAGSGERPYLVSTNSLYKLADKQLVIDAIKADLTKK
jgi:hypothetical protein